MALAIVNGYTALATLKARLGLAVADSADDTMLETIITAVSREIDDFCGRRFYAVSEARHFTARQAGLLLVDDLLSISALVTDEDGDRTYETSWVATDYDLYPFNAQLESQPQPYWRIDVTPQGKRSFPVGVARSVKVTGSWGFSSATPAVVEQACLFQCGLEYRGKDAPLGISGGGEFQQQVQAVGLHPFTKRLLAVYRRLSVG